MNSANSIVKLSKPTKLGEKEYTYGAYIESFMYSEETLQIWIDEIIDMMKEDELIERSREVNFIIQCVPLNLVNLQYELSKIIERLEIMKSQNGENFDESKIDEYYKVIKASQEFNDVSHMNDTRKQTNFIDLRAEFETVSILTTDFDIERNSQNERIYQMDLSNLNKVRNIVKYALIGERGSNFTNKVYSGKAYIISNCSELLNLLKGLNLDGSQLKKRVFRVDEFGKSEEEIMQERLRLEQEAADFRQERINSNDKIFNRITLNNKTKKKRKIYHTK